MKPIEKALHARLLKDGRNIIRTAVPDSWPGDEKLREEARWWSQNEPKRRSK